MRLCLIRCYKSITRNFIYLDFTTCRYNSSFSVSVDTKRHFIYLLRKMNNYQWEASHIGYTLPHNSIVGGKDSDGSVIYVARSSYLGTKLPAKAIPSKRACYVSCNGAEILVERFEVLTGDSSFFSWEPSSNGKSVANAISTDKLGNEMIFIGRAPFSNSLTIGKILPSHRCMYIPYDGKEHRIEHYEILVYQKKPQSSFNLIDFDTPKRNQRLHIKKNFTTTQSTSLANSFLTPNRSTYPTTISKLEWTSLTSSSTIPTTALIGGRDSSHSTLYIGRCMLDGNLLPCKVIPNKRMACVTFNGVEFEKPSFEILIGSNVKWVSSSHGNVPAKAFPAGYTKNGEVLYIGRTNYNGGLIVGRIDKNQRCLLIGYNGREYSFPNYEALIED